MKICLSFGKKLVTIPILMCLCIIYMRSGKIDYGDDLLGILIKTWQTMEIEDDPNITALSLASLSYYCTMENNIKAIGAVDGILPALLKHVKTNRTNFDTDFYEKYCQIPLILLLKYLATDPEI